MPFVALAGIGVIGEALIALGILAGVWLIAYLVGKFGSYIPVIGGWLATQTNSFLAWSLSQVSSAFQGALWALDNLVGVVVICVTWPFAKVQAFTTATTNALWWVKYVLVPSASNALVNLSIHYLQLAYSYAYSLYQAGVNFSNQVLAQAFSWATLLYWQAIGIITSVANTAYAYALALYNQSIAYANAVLHNAYAYALAVFYQLAGSIANLDATLRALLGIAVTSLESQIIAVEQKLTALIQAYVAAAEKDIITIVDGAAVVSLQDVWPNLITDVDGLLAEIPQELIDIRDQIASIPRAIPQSLLDALTGLGALAVPLLRYLKDCGVPMCRDLHGLSDLLGGLTDLAADAALLAFIVDMVSDPHHAAREVSDVVGPITRDAESLFKSLLGV